MESPVTSDHCLICDSENLSNNGSSPSDEFQVDFIFRNILEIPVDKVKGYLGKCEGSLEWLIRLCDRCCDAVDKAKRIYDEILESTRKYAQVKKEIIDEVRGASGKKRKSRLTTKSAVKEESDVPFEIRQFMQSHEYGSFSFPFQLDERDHLENLSTVLLEAVPVVKTEPFEAAEEEEDNHLQVEEVPTSKIKMEAEEKTSDSENWESGPKEEAEDDDWSSSDKRGGKGPSSTSTSGGSAPPTVVKRRNKAAEHSVDESKLGHGHVCVCGKSFPNLGRLTSHVRYFMDEPKFRCQRCPMAFFDHSNLKQHMARAHDIKLPAGTIGCQDCGVLFKDRKAHKEHRIKAHPKYGRFSKPHGEDRPNSSKGSFKYLCGKEYTTGADLRQHVRRFTSTFDFKCDTCGKHFKTSAGLVAHSELAHRNKAVPVPEMSAIDCVICGESFKMRKLYQLHMHKIHDKSADDATSSSRLHGVRPVTMTESSPGYNGTLPRCLCGSPFSTQDRLLKHIQRMFPRDPLK